MSMNDLTDGELMARIAKSDTEAFQTLLKRYSDKVYAFAWRLTTNKTDAEDMTQEVFFKVWRNAESWQPNAKLSTWLYKILYNHYIDTVRKTKPTENTIPELPSLDDSPEQSLLKKLDAQEITDAINSLPDRQKEALILCYHEDLKAKEAAELLSLSVGALESLLFRARQALKEKLLARKEAS